jgi:hypothetical protein
VKYVEEEKTAPLLVVSQQSAGDEKKIIKHTTF